MINVWILIINESICYIFNDDFLSNLLRSNLRIILFEKLFELSIIKSVVVFLFC